MSDTPPQPAESNAKAADAAQAATWLNMGERGAMAGIRVVFWLATLFGRWPTRQLVRVLALYYRIFDRAAVRASRQWLAHVHGRPPGWWEVYRHILRFALVTLDRMFLLQGKVGGLEFTRTGHDNLDAQLATGRGAILLGAHLGSYEAMRYGGESTDVPINIVGFFENAKMINTLIERLNPGAAARVIHIGEGRMSFMLKIRDAIERGELVAIMGDRVGLGERPVPARFFGEEAYFSAGPFLLASVLKCPVYLTFGLYHEPNRYNLYCKPFAARLDLPRGRRDEAIREHVQRYAEELEGFCREAPDNWFNFYDFWSPPSKTAEART